MAKAAGLEVFLGSPLHRISCKVFDPDDWVLEYIFGHYRPDQYRYHMSLTRMLDGKRMSW